MNVAPQAADASKPLEEVYKFNKCERKGRYRLVLRPSGQIYFDLHNIMVKIFDELPFAVRYSSI